MEEVKIWIPWPSKMEKKLFSRDFHQLFLKTIIYNSEMLCIQFLTEKGTHQLSVNFIADSPFRCISLEHTMDIDEYIGCLMKQAKVSAPITPFFMRRNSEFIQHYLEQDSIFDVVQPHSLVQYTLYAWHNLIDVVTWEPPQVIISEIDKDR